MPEIRKASKDSMPEGGKKGAPTNPGTVHNVSNEGTANGQKGGKSAVSSKHGRNKSIGR